MPKAYSAAQSWASLIGRILISLIFIVAGIYKWIHYNTLLTAVTQAGLYYPQLLFILSIIIELLGGLLVLFGWFTRFGAFLLFLLTLIILLGLHLFSMTDKAGETMNQMSHMTHMMKYLSLPSLIGGLLYIMAFGAGGFSFDSSRRSKD